MYSTLCCTYYKKTFIEYRTFEYISEVIRRFEVNKNFKGTLSSTKKKTLYCL